VRGTILPVLMLLIGIALLVRTIAASPDGVAFGLVLGVLFIAAGAGRLYLEHRSR
jgi:hypothetical protein